jgi:hypothetical protein
MFQTATVSRPPVRLPTSRAGIPSIVKAYLIFLILRGFVTLMAFALVSPPRLRLSAYSAPMSSSPSQDLILAKTEGPAMTIPPECAML